MDSEPPRFIMGNNWDVLSALPHIRYADTYIVPMLCVGTILVNGYLDLARVDADGRQYSLQNRNRSGRASGYNNIHGNYVGDLAAARIAFTENSTIATAVSKRDNQFRIGRGVVSAFKGYFHMP